nr:methyl-accepting chemotaxis protein [Lachnospiraceae bacterium]
MKTRKLGIRKKIILYVFLIYILICILIDIFYVVIKNYVVEQYANASMGTTLVAASEIDGDLFENIKSEKDEYYDIAYDILSKYKVNSKIKYIYTIKLVDDELRFVIDTDDEEPAEFDEAYDDNEYMIKAIKTGKAVAEKEITSDEWGESISVYAPIKNSNDETVGIVGCDCEFTTLSNKLKRLESVLYSVMIGFMAVCIFVSFFMSRGISKNLTELYYKLKNLNTGRKKGDKRLVVTSGDEIELVANEFNRFIGQFEKLVDNVSGVSVEINKNATGINDMIEDSNYILEKMSVKLDKIKTRMQEASASTESMAQKLKESTDTIKSINEEAMLSKENAINYRNSANISKDEIKEASEKTIETINAFKSKLELNVKRCSEIENIDMITEGILKLADTTGILAQNTHIEAARI